MKTKSNKHTYYNYQFKWTAVKLSEHADIQGRSVAEALDIHPIMLYRWRKEMRDGDLSDNGKETGSKRKLEEAQKKIRQLEADLKRVRDENIVLRKAERLFPAKK